MKVIRSAATAALLVALSAVADAKSVQQYESEFAQWMTNHHLTFADALEYAHRLETYIANDLFIARHNAENKWSFTLGHNQFSHLTFDEFKQYKTGLKISRQTIEERLKYTPSDLRASATDALESVDWVTKGGVTPVKNQGMCGSCWAFSTTGAVEGAAFVSSGKLVSFSEQQLVDCDDNGDMGCNGGLMDHAFSWIEHHRGLCTEEEYDYHAKQGVCRDCTPVVKVTGFQDVEPNNEEALKAAVAQQPVSVAIEADQKEFQFYKSGVFDKKCGTQLDHGVLAVGYGEEGGAKFWKVKNSWGEKWGENGYIRMTRGAKTRHGQCGIAMVPSYPFASLIKKDQNLRGANATVTTVMHADKLEQALGSSAKIMQCGDKAKSMVVFDTLQITPDAPKRGKPVSFFGNGEIKKNFDIAEFKLDVRLAGERVFSHKGKICGETHVPLPLGLGHIDVHGFNCPVTAGKFSDLKVDVNLPKIAPAGNYEIDLVAGDSDAAADDLFCVHVDLDLVNHGEVEEKARVFEPLTVM